MNRIVKYMIAAMMLLLAGELPLFTGMDVMTASIPAMLGMVLLVAPQSWVDEATHYE